ncbi:hypothetical protein ACWDSJ_12050 [Nocardia sp. NPDC003482]
MRDDEIPGLTPRIAAALHDSGKALADRVRADILHGPRPVFLYYLAQSFDTLTATLARGGVPRPATPAQQLCLHLMLEHTERHRDAVDHDTARVRAALLADGAHEPLAALVRHPGQPDVYDFVGLGDALSARGMGAFFAPVEPDSLVA